LDLEGLILRPEYTPYLGYEVPLNGFTVFSASHIFKNSQLIPAIWNRKRNLELLWDDDSAQELYNTLQFGLINKDEEIDHEVVLILNMTETDVNWNTIVSRIFKMNDFALLVLREAHDLTFPVLGLTRLPSSEDFLTDDKVR